MRIVLGALWFVAMLVLAVMLQNTTPAPSSAQVERSNDALTVVVIAHGAQ